MDCRGADDEDEEIGFNVDPSFEEVPSGWLERCRWNVSGFGRWITRTWLPPCALRIRALFCRACLEPLLFQPQPTCRHQLTDSPLV